MELLLTIACAAGLVIGFLLLWNISLIPEASSLAWPVLEVSVIIPARNEEKNLPALLSSLMQSEPGPAEVIVVDDGSTDDTAKIAISFGATVLTSAPLESGWRGKNWACHQGALAASSETYLFLDADTSFTPNGFQRLIAFFCTLPPESALSVLPFHTTRKPYEELSLFFNLLMAIGAGGFNSLDSPRLFGQSLLIHRDLYSRSGGHASVRRYVLENLHFAPHLRSANGTPHTVSGRGTLLIRMFPHGLDQLRESWEKAFVSGAGATSLVVLSLCIYWLSSAGSVALLAITGLGFSHPIAIIFYLAFASQIAWMSRQIGTFRFITALLYPIPLLFYFFTFGRSAWLQRSRRFGTWKGRQL